MAALALPGYSELVRQCAHARVRVRPIQRHVYIHSRREVGMRVVVVVGVLRTPGEPRAAHRSARARVKRNMASIHSTAFLPLLPSFYRCFTRQIRRRRKM